MADPRTLHSVLVDLETVYFDVTRLASAIEVIGARAKAEGVDASHGGGIEVLGEFMTDRASQLGRLLDEACVLAACP